VRTLAGNYQVLAAYPRLLGPQNRMWLHFVSYKFARLLLPWLLATIAAVSSFCRRRGGGQLWVVRRFFYALALVDRGLPQDSLLKRVSSPVRTFVVLMLAAACAVSVLFVPAQTLWKETTVKSSPG